MRFQSLLRYSSTKYTVVEKSAGILVLRESFILINVKYMYYK